MNLDPSLAYTAIINMCRPMRSDVSRQMVADLSEAMTAANPRNRWEFAGQWLIANHPGHIREDALKQS